MLLAMALCFSIVSVADEPLVIHGYVLPPEPDPDVNNATLLGVDSNSNGVRDDVERWIYTRYNTYIPCVEKEVKVFIPTTGETITGYKKVCEDERKPYHQIVREIAMQGARAAQIIIQEPEKARETRKYFEDAVYCGSYFKHFAEYRNEPLLLDHYIFGDEFKTIQFNTSQRVSAFATYNSVLSGGVYPGRSIDEKRASCMFDIDELLKE